MARASNTKRQNTWSTDDGMIFRDSKRARRHAAWLELVGILEVNVREYLAVMGPLLSADHPATIDSMVETLTPSFADAIAKQLVANPKAAVSLLNRGACNLWHESSLDPGPPPAPEPEPVVTVGESVPDTEPAPSSDHGSDKQPRDGATA